MTEANPNVPRPFFADPARGLCLYYGDALHRTALFHSR